MTPRPSINRWSYVRDDHYWTSDNLSIENDGLDLDGTHAEYSSSRQVDNWRAEQATEDTTIRVIINRVSSTCTQGEKSEEEHGERATHHVFNCQFAITRLLAKFRDSLLDILESHRLCIPQHRRGETHGA